MYHEKHYIWLWFNLVNGSISRVVSDSLPYHRAGLHEMNVNTHFLCQQRASGGAGEAVGWAQAVFWCKWSISSPCMFQTPSKGNKDFCLPTYLLRFNTMSVVAVSNTLPSFVFLCHCILSLFYVIWHFGLEESLWKLNLTLTRILRIMFGYVQW